MVKSIIQPLENEEEQQLVEKQQLKIPLRPFAEGEQQNWFNSFYLDGLLRNNLDIIKKYVTQQDGDAFIIVSGPEGSGKSVFAMQICKYLDPSFDISRVCFNGKQWKHAVLNSQKFQAVLHDEALNSFSWFDRHGWEAKELQMLVFEMRQRNLFNVLVCPQFYDLTRTVALHRSLCLINTYTVYSESQGLLRRGFFSFYNKAKKQWLWLNYKKSLSYPLKERNFFGRFTSKYVVDKQLYLQKKSEGLQEAYSERSKRKERNANINDALNTLSTELRKLNK